MIKIITLDRFDKIVGNNPSIIDVVDKDNNIFDVCVVNNKFYLKSYYDEGDTLCIEMDSQDDTDFVASLPKNNDIEQDEKAIIRYNRQFKLDNLKKEDV